MTTFETGLSERTFEKIKRVLRENCSENVEVLLFGSRAIGTFREGSDIDICVKSRNFTHGELLKLELALDLLNLPYKIDLCHFEKIENEKLKLHIERFGVVIFKHT